MKEKLIEILEQFCPNNVFLQGTLDENVSYPESFITFWTNSTESGAFYDDDENAFIYDFSVYYYSSDPAQVGAVPPQIRTALKQAGFIPQGKGNDIPSDVPTHTGWVMEFLKKETITN